MENMLAKIQLFKSIKKLKALANRFVKNHSNPRLYFHLIITIISLSTKTCAQPFIFTTFGIIKFLTIL